MLSTQNYLQQSLSHYSRIEIADLDLVVADFTCDVFTYSSDVIQSWLILCSSQSCCWRRTVRRKTWQYKTITQLRQAATQRYPKAECALCGTRVSNPTLPNSSSLVRPPWQPLVSFATSRICSSVAPTLVNLSFGTIVCCVVRLFIARLSVLLLIRSVSFSFQFTVACFSYKVLQSLFYESFGTKIEMQETGNNQQAVFGEIIANYSLSGTISRWLCARETQNVCNLLI